MASISFPSFGTQPQLGDYRGGNRGFFRIPIFRRSLERGGRWRGYNRPDFLQMDVVEWARDHARRDSMSPIIRTENWLVAILHFATGAPFGRLPDVENLPLRYAVRRDARSCSSSVAILLWSRTHVRPIVRRTLVPCRHTLTCVAW